MVVYSRRVNVAHSFSRFTAVLLMVGALDEAMMQYRVQFHDRLNNVIREMRTDASSAETALFQRRVNMACPPNAAGVHVLDWYGRNSASRDFVRELYP